MTIMRFHRMRYDNFDCIVDRKAFMITGAERATPQKFVLSVSLSKPLVIGFAFRNQLQAQPGGESDRPPSQPRPQKVNRSKVARWQGWKSRGKLSKKHKGQTNVKRPDAVTVKGLS